MDAKKLLISGVLSLAVLISSTGTLFAQSFSYTVKKGDTFGEIGYRYGVSAIDIMRANNADINTVIYPGQTITVPSAGQIVHTVQSGETYWIISKKYRINLHKLLSENGASDKTILYIGDRVLIPSSSELIHTVVAGETFYIISKKYGISLLDLLELNGADENTIIYIGQKIKIPVSYLNGAEPSKPYVTYTSYTVQKNDNIWNIAIKFGLPYYELLNANGLNESSQLSVGSILKIPVHHIPVKDTPGAKYGEFLEWWSEAQYVIPRESSFTVVDFYTGKSFKAKRTGGANHADCETLTLEDTEKMKEIWGGEFSWVRRPVTIMVNGRKIAASATAMPHAGNDSVPGGVWADWRSGNYPSGTNYDWIKNNGAHGHFDIHFLNSTRHKDGQLDTKHQSCVEVAAGIK